METQTMEMTMEVEHNGPQGTGLPLVLSHTTCIRCGGLMVTEFCLDLLDDTGKLSFLARRCVQCGDLVDPIILKNRHHPEALVVHKSRNIRAHVRADKQFSRSNG
jgi:ribosomal protein S27AE